MVLLLSGSEKVADRVAHPNIYRIACLAMMAASWLTV
jgi:hypothetical protein